MKIILLGTGSPIVDTERHGPATLLEINNECLLFDTGRGVVLQLFKANIELKNIGLIFITHHHVDHISDLGDLLLAIWKSGRDSKIQIFGPNGTSDLVSALLNKIFVRDIEYTIALENSLNNNIRDIRELVNVNDIQSGFVFKKDSIQIRAEFVEHGQTFLGFTQNNWPSLGYRIETNTKILAISGDSVVCDGLTYLTQNVDILIQCCYLSETDINSPERKILSQYIIASADTIGYFASQQKINLLVLTHFRKKDINLIKDIELEIKKNFSGQLILGKDLQVINI